MARLIRSGALKGYISAHTLAETYAFLTGIGRQRPVSVKHVIEQEVLPYFEVVALTHQEYIELLDYLIENNIVGAAVYDAIHVCVAQKANVDLLVHANSRDFKTVCPTPPPQLISLSEETK